MLIVMIALTGVLVDGSRIRAADAIVQDAVEACAQDILTGYDGKLKKDYGLMSIYNLSEDELENYVFEGLNANLLVEKGYFDIYDFVIEDVRVTPIYSLAEPEVSRRQIIEFMKYRAPLEAVDGFITKLGTIKSFSNQSKTLGKKISVERKLKDVRKHMVGLYCETEVIRKFGKSELNKKIDKYAEAIAGKIYSIKQKDKLEKELEEKEEALDDVEDRIDSKEKKIRKLESDIDKKEEKAEEGGIVDVSSEKESIKELKSKKSELTKKKNELNSEIKNLKSKISDLEDDIDDFANDAKKYKAELISLLIVYKNANKNASDLVKTLLKKLPDIESEIIEVTRSLEGDNSDFAIRIRNELLKISENVSIAGLNNIKLAADKNKEIIQAILDEVDGLEKKTRDIKGENKNDIKNQVDLKINVVGEINQYDKTLKYVPDPEPDGEEIDAYKNNKKPKVDKNAKESDPREAVSEKAADKKESEKEEDFNEIGNDLYSKLPHATYTKEEEEKEGTFYDNMEFGEDSDNPKSEEGLNIFAAIGGMIGEKIKNMGTDMRDEIYFNEYLLMTFKNAVSDKEKLPDMKKLDFRGEPLTSRDTFFKKGEIEYILTGNKNENTNLLFVKGQILAVRFAMNTIAIYMDAEKRNEALALATGIAGWTGFGIPIVQTLIMCSWSMAESLIDLDTLANGENVPFYKRNWVLSPKGGIQKLKDMITGKTISEANKAADEVMDKVDSIISTKIENILVESFAKLKTTGSETEKILRDQINESLETTEESKGIMGEIERKIKEYIKNLSDDKLQKLKDSYNCYLEQSQEDVNNEIIKIIDEINVKIKKDKDDLVKELRKKAEEGIDSLEKYVEENIPQKDVGNIKGDYIDMSYLDYLRLLLLIQDSKKTTLRMEDLIQINTNGTRPYFNLSEQNTLVKIDATVSMKYMFVTKSFMPSSVKTEDGERHIIHKVIYEGY